MLLAVSLLFSALEDLMRWKFFWFVEFWLIGLEMWASWLWWRVTGLIMWAGTTFLSVVDSEVLLLVLLVVLLAVVWW